MVSNVVMRTFTALVFLLSIRSLAQSNCRPPPQTFNDAISDTRKLRRISLVLRGNTPPEAELMAMASAAPAARTAFIENAITTGLADPQFYQQMFYFGQEWISIGPFTQGAQGDAYQGDMAGHLFQCPANTAHAGKYFINNDVNNPYISGETSARLCRNLNKDNLAFTPATAQMEPWWAPGTQISVVGAAAGNVTSVPGPNGTMLDCGIAQGGYYDPALEQGCSCGPNLIWCIPFVGLQAGSLYDLKNLQRRLPFEEPARLLAHIAWHDKDLSDLVLGNYSVGPNMLQHLYTRWGRQQGPKATDANNTWWKPAVDASLRDPLHPTAADALAWREFVVENRNPYLLALAPSASGGLTRTYAFDPRTTVNEPLGLPAAGVLTMMGPNSSYPRERVRAARFMEMFACQSFSPPAPGSTFPAYTNDPAQGGTCKHCHATMDPAAIHFKRWDFSPRDGSSVPWPFLAGMGRFRISPIWISGMYPHSAADITSPGYRWRNAFIPSTIMTPVTATQIMMNPETILLDTMPSTYTLFGQAGDGTMGPLGFGRALVKSGEFDRCAVKRMYERVIGRELLPDELEYQNALVTEFVSKGRKVKPFIKHLMQQPEFGRGL
jgi:hypothetical protein